MIILDESTLPRFQEEFGDDRSLPVPTPEDKEDTEESLVRIPNRSPGSMSLEPVGA